jgi:hypothetical protein
MKYRTMFTYIGGYWKKKFSDEISYTPGENNILGMYHIGAKNQTKLESGPSQSPAQYTPTAQLTTLAHVRPLHVGEGDGMA